MDYNALEDYTKEKIKIWVIDKYEKGYSDGFQTATQITKFLTTTERAYASGYADAKNGLPDKSLIDKKITITEDDVMEGQSITDRMAIIFKNITLALINGLPKNYQETKEYAFLSLLYDSFDTIQKQALATHNAGGNKNDKD